MKTFFKTFWISVFLLAIPYSCNKNSGPESAIQSQGGVEIFLITDFTTLNGSAQINESSVTTKTSPLIYYSEIVSYNPQTYSFEITEAAKKRITKIQFPVHGTPFALKVDGELIYTGYFWPSYSSASCQWTVIDPTFLYLRNKLTVEMGYPGTFTDILQYDRRNDSRILNKLERDNKIE
jgi:hypothetical protein